MKRLLLLIAFLTMPVCGEDFMFVEKSVEGLIVRSNAKSDIFVYDVSGSDFSVISIINNKEVKMTLEEKGDSLTLEKHEEAARSVTHGRFIASPANFVVDYPEGYNSENFPKNVILRVRYRKVVKNMHTKELRLSEIISVEIKCQRK